MIIVTRLCLIQSVPKVHIAYMHVHVGNKEPGFFMSIFQYQPLFQSPNSKFLFTFKLLVRNFVDES